MIVGGIVVGLRKFFYFIFSSFGWKVCCLGSVFFIFIRIRMESNVNLEDM